MAVNLVKGQKVELRKNTGGELRKVVVGLGWDEVKQKRGWFAPKSQDIDCDASAYLCVDGKIRDGKDIVFYNHLQHESGCVKHMGDNLVGGTGAGRGDDEQIMIELATLPARYDKIIVVVTIYDAMNRRQHFGMIQNAYIRICDADTNQELCRYNLSDNYDNMFALVFGELYKHNGAWSFNAIGQATRDNNVIDLAKRFM